MISPFFYNVEDPTAIHLCMVRAVSESERLLYYFSFFDTKSVMLEINPVQNQINDLKGRVDALRRYL